MTIRELLQLAADLGADFRESLDTRRVGATATADELRSAPGAPTDVVAVGRPRVGVLDVRSSRPAATTRRRSRPGCASSAARC